MQLMPATARQLHVRDPFSAAQSIDGGARYLARLLRLYGGDRRLAAAAYNAGPAAVAKFGGVPPYAETRAYVEKVELLRSRYVAALKSL
jgi:soluble lytic murein transglycosylase-like protein